MKALITCLGQVLAAVDPSLWPSAVRPFSLLLQLLLDERPKVRKRAQDAAHSVLVSMRDTPARQPASDAVLKSAPPCSCCHIRPGQSHEVDELDNAVCRKPPSLTAAGKHCRVCAVSQRVLPGPEAGARMAAQALGKQRKELEAKIAKATADALHLLGWLRMALPVLPGEQHLKAPTFACKDEA